jgi:hypothetical protein
MFMGHLVVMEAPTGVRRESNKTSSPRAFHFVWWKQRALLPFENEYLPKDNVSPKMNSCKLSPPKTTKFSDELTSWIYLS